MTIKNRIIFSVFVIFLITQICFAEDLGLNFETSSFGDFGLDYGSYSDISLDYGFYNEPVFDQNFFDYSSIDYGLSSDASSYDLDLSSDIGFDIYYQERFSEVPTLNDAFQTAYDKYYSNDFSYDYSYDFGNVFANEANSIDNKALLLDSDARRLEYYGNAKNNGDEWLYANGLMVSGKDVTANNPITMSKRGTELYIEHNGDLTVAGIDLASVDSYDKARLQKIRQDFTIVTGDQIIMKHGNNLYIRPKGELNLEATTVQGKVEFNFADANNFKSLSEAVAYAEKRTTDSYNALINKEKDELYLTELASKVYVRDRLAKIPEEQRKSFTYQDWANIQNEAFDEIKAKPIDEIKKMITDDRIKLSQGSPEEFAAAKKVDFEIVKSNLPIYAEIKNEDYMTQSGAFYRVTKTNSLNYELKAELLNYNTPTYSKDKELYDLHKKINHQLEDGGLTAKGIVGNDVTTIKLGNDVAIKQNDALTRRNKDYLKYGLDSDVSAALYNYDPDTFKLIYDFSSPEKLNIEKGNTFAKYLAFLNAKYPGENACAIIRSADGNMPEYGLMIKTDPKTGAVSFQKETVENLQKLHEYYVVDTKDVSGLANMLPKNMDAKQKEMFKLILENPDENVAYNGINLIMNHALSSKDVAGMFTGENAGSDELMTAINDLNKKDPVEITFKTIWGTLFGGNARRTDEALLLKNNLEGQTRVSFQPDDTQESYVTKLVNFESKANELKAELNRKSFDANAFSQRVTEFSNLAGEYGVYGTTADILADMSSDELYRFRRNVRLGVEGENNIGKYNDVIAALKTTYPAVAENIVSELVGTTDSYFVNMFSAKINENPLIDENTKKTLTSEDNLYKLQYTFNENLRNTKDLKESSYAISDEIVTSLLSSKFEGFSVNDQKRIMAREDVKKAVTEISHALTDSNFGDLAAEDATNIFNKNTNIIKSASKEEFSFVFGRDFVKAITENIPGGQTTGMQTKIQNLVTDLIKNKDVTQKTHIELLANPTFTEKIYEILSDSKLTLTDEQKRDIEKIKNSKNTDSAKKEFLKTFSKIIFSPEEETAKSQTVVPVQPIQPPQIVEQPQVKPASGTPKLTQEQITNIMTKGITDTTSSMNFITWDTDGLKSAANAAIANKDYYQTEEVQLAIASDPKVLEKIFSDISNIEVFYTKPLKDLKPTTYEIAEVSNNIKQSKTPNSAITEIMSVIQKKYPNAFALLQKAGMMPK